MRGCTTRKMPQNGLGDLRYSHLLYFVDLEK
jgi:hypothetical protein